MTHCAYVCVWLWVSGVWERAIRTFPRVCRGNGKATYSNIHLMWVADNFRVCFPGHIYGDTAGICYRCDVIDSGRANAFRPIILFDKGVCAYFFRVYLRKGKKIPKPDLHLCAYKYELNVWDVWPLYWLQIKEIRTSTHNVFTHILQECLLCCVYINSIIFTCTQVYIFYPNQMYFYVSFVCTLCEFWFRS